MPITESEVETRPSLAPNTAARNVPDSRRRPRRQTAHDLAVDLLVGDHACGRERLAVVRRASFRVLRQSEHEDRAEPPGHPAQKHRAEARRRQARRFAAEQFEPVRLAPLGVGEGQQDLALLFPALGEVAVACLCALVGEIARPAAAVTGVGTGTRGHGIHASRARRRRDADRRDCQHFGRPNRDLGQESALAAASRSRARRRRSAGRRTGLVTRIHRRSRTPPVSPVRAPAAPPSGASRGSPTGQVACSRPPAVGAA
jgi:hypothetical protein